jgi:hypothetical protein
MIEERRLVDQPVRGDALPERSVEELAVVERRRIDRRLEVLDRLDRRRSVRSAEQLELGVHTCLATGAPGSG